MDRQPGWIAGGMAAGMARAAGPLACGFVIARPAFWIGYHRTRPTRVVGFAATFFQPWHRRHGRCG